MEAKVMTFDEAWPILQEEAINKIIDHVEGVQTHHFTSEEYLQFYTLVYNVCHPNQFGPETQKMYKQYNNTYQDHISAKVLPSLRGKEDEQLLKELVKRWNNHKIITRWLSKYFHYLDRYYCPRFQLPSTKESSYQAFYNLVYGEMNDQIRNAIILLIDRERGGEEIDQALVKEAVNIYVEMADGARDTYQKDFEETMINATKEFYSRRALEWITNDSYDDYMLKMQRCLNHEKTKVSNYLQFNSKNGIVEVAEHELLKQSAKLLEGKKNESGDNLDLEDPSGAGGNQPA